MTAPMNLDHAPAFGQRNVRLDTLIRLRWLAVGGQTATVLVVGLVFGFPLPVPACFGLIAASALLNVVLRLRFSSSRRLSEPNTAMLLGFDILQLAALLYLTGGLVNPFAFLMIAPVMISATALPPQKTLLLASLVLIAATFLAIHHLPLPWYEGEVLELPLLYIGAVWLALTCSLGLMGVFTFRVADEARQLSDALAATELVLAREQHLSALDGLAAAAAHELGTPLATIALVSKELEREIEAGSPHAEDVRLLRTQTDRCRDILRKLTTLANEPDGHFDRMSLAQLIEEVVAPTRDFGIDVHVLREGSTPDEPIVARSPAILYGLGNLLENAVDFAETDVHVTARWSDDRVTIEIEDDGRGFSETVLDRLGDPYVTSRATRSAGGGLGLGVFIAKTLLERSGARLTFANRRPPKRGACVEAEWERAAIDLSRSPDAGPSFPA
ncbi:ActS/PrrB/RegB family redox-sensitive histidine kinase [Amorphus orientalis]|uniref:histidine kinase n=1 Tax=Amorphus orientalis TaxID=649198 RepID=A0AAE3VLR0_9HYPH|nr:ActS/PrrB/RegB family redox-sensitive histidine kinase [Amorphus orientalis]MDQ0314001.1 two-component system sensor histidine kinase RegB [Amorphus orientalis]